LILLSPVGLGAVRRVLVEGELFDSNTILFMNLAPRTFSYLIFLFYIPCIFLLNFCL
ncbi:unnamed protein product, partial [Tuber aestivum]